MVRAFCLALMAVAASASLAFAQTPDPIVRTEGLKQLSPHVHVIPDNSVPLVPNVGFIVGDAGIMVVDTGLGPRNGAAVLEVAKKLGGSRKLYLVVTHFHPEHDLGAQVFPPDTTLIRSADQIKDIDEFGLQLAKVFASRSAINAELLKDADFRKANVTFEKEYTVDLGGGVMVKLVAMGANHTRGDTAFWVEPDKVLFSGDVAMRPQPAFASPYSNVRHWLASLDRLEAFKPAIIVPSHGPVGDGTMFASGYRTYLIEVRDRAAAEKKAGHGVEQTTEAVTSAMAGRYPDKGRLAGAIKAAYAEAP
ncbi:MAG: MBL fold metallo-hydrolase [Pseudolabrys sp.]|nr:MBL fold metallo-hydrolase [Pseudolabrys sp.]